MRILCFLTILTLGALAASPSPAAARDRQKALPRIAVTAIVEHATVDAMRQGIDDGLIAAGLTPGEAVTITFESANASLDHAREIARSLLRRNVNLVIALSEPSARAVADLPFRVPVVIAGLPVAKADAIAADRKAHLLTGVGSGDVHGAHIDLIATIHPSTRRVLVPYVPANGAEPAMLRTLIAAARTRTFSVEAIRIPAAPEKADILPDDADAETVLYLSQSAVGAAADTLIREAARHGMLVVADQRDLVVRGAAATIIHDSYAIGRQAGEIAAAILRDPSLARQPIQRAEARHLIVNAEAADDKRLRFPFSLTGAANEVIEWSRPDGPYPVVKPEVPLSRLESPVDKD